MQIIVLTQDNPIKHEIDTINKLLDNGLEKIHIRKPSFSLKEYREYILQIKKEYYTRIVLHGGFDLLKEYEIGGIHLNSIQRKDEKLYSTVANNNISISASTHSWDEVLEEKKRFEYLFISPVFDSISKEGYTASIDLNGLGVVKQKLAIKNLYCPKIIGLGGVNVPHIPILKQYQFDGAAVYGAIWRSTNPLAILNGLLAMAK